jgi:hypothetical protein
VQGRPQCPDAHPTALLPDTLLASDQLSVPAEQRIRRHGADQAVQRGSPQRFGLYCQSSALVVGEPEAPSSELFAQDAVLLAQVVDDQLLAPMAPSSYSKGKNLQNQSIRTSTVAASRA